MLEIVDDCGVLGNGVFLLSDVCVVDCGVVFVVLDDIC